MAGIIGLSTQESLIRDKANSVFIQYQDIDLVAGGNKYFTLNNISNIPFNITQLLHFSVYPDITINGKSHLDIQLYLNTDITTDLIDTSDISIYSNSNTGITNNIKGLMLETYEILSFDDLANNKYILIDADCIGHDSATGLYRPVNNSVKLSRPLYLGAGRQLILRMRNTAITDPGIAGHIHLSFMGQFMKPIPGLFELPITVDSADITSDSNSIHVDQSEL